MSERSREVTSEAEPPSNGDRSLNWSPRTILRLFLLFGGLSVVYWGVTGDDTLNIVVGTIGTVLGAIGLLVEYRK